MRNSLTDQLGKNLTAAFQLSGETPKEFLESIEGTVACWESEYEGIQFVTSNILSDGEIFTGYWTSERPSEIFVKI